VRHVFCGFGSRLPTGRAPDYHASCGPMWTVGLKHEEKPSSLSVQYDLPVPNAHTRTLPRRLQNMRATTTLNAYKMCG
jgi:hypothetical protein